MNSINAQTTHLLIDAGNTRIKFALADRSAQGYRYVGHCASQVSAADIAVFLQATLGTVNTLHAHGVCVVGDGVKHAIAQALQAVSVVQAINWLSGSTPLAGLRNDYATPATLGADRWLAAYGVSQQLAAQFKQAKQSKQHAAVLATFGTATTIDVIIWDDSNKTHVFVGGIIIAGINTALRSVSTSTAQLPDLQAALVQLQPPHGLDPKHGIIPIPNCTQDALLMGAVLVQAGAVRCVLDLSAQRYGAVQCYIAGGAASVMQPYLVQAAQVQGYTPIQTLEYPVFIGLASVISHGHDSESLLA